MIIRTKLDFGRIVRTLGRNLFILLVYDTTVTAVYLLGEHRIGIDNLPLSLLGSAIAIIVTFRNNAAYNRWWEARGLWGMVVNNSRSFARGLYAFLDDTAVLHRLVRLQIAYAVALRFSLLGTPSHEAIAPYVPAPLLARLRAQPPAGAQNMPTALQNAIAVELASCRRSGTLDVVGLRSLEQTLSDLANAQGGLERVKKTPLPRQYNHFPQVFIAVYCLLLPIGLVHDLGLWTPFGSTIVGFMFLALDRIGRDLEDPFEDTVHDVPMQAITRTIEIDLLQAIDSDTVPDRVTERNGVLW